MNLRRIAQDSQSDICSTGHDLPKGREMRAKEEARVTSFTVERDGEDACGGFAQRINEDSGINAIMTK